MLAGVCCSNPSHPSLNNRYRNMCFVWFGSVLWANWVFVALFAAITFHRVFCVQNYCGCWQSILFRVVLSVVRFSSLCARFFFHFRCSLFEFVCVWCFLILCMRFFSLSTSRSSFTVVLNGATHATKHAISIIFPINEKLKGRSCSRLQKM